MVNDSDIEMKDKNSNNRGSGEDMEKNNPDFEMMDGSDPTKADAPIKRDRWGSSFDFILACIGFSIGYGNVWRFPYLVYKNGGGAFFIPFFIAVALGGIPIFFLEVITGQFMSAGAIKVWDMVPLFQGIGFASIIIVFFLNCYYNILLTWSVHYLFSSFTTGALPWNQCEGWWNDNTTCTILSDKRIKELSNLTANHTWSTPGEIAYLDEDRTRWINASHEWNFTDAATEYWENKVLRISDGIDNPGPLHWDLVLALIGSWLFVYICICKGIKTSGKVMYVTATSPYIFMIILLIRGLLLEGAGEGVRYYLATDFSKLSESTVWVDAGTQVFFSYSISLGVLNALGSFNPFYHNSLRDSVIFSLVDTFTCVLAGFVIFPILGHMAHERGVTIDEVAEKGPGLAFIAYPKAVTLLPAAPVWSVLFFIMLILLGLDSQFVGVEGFVTAVMDMFPRQINTPVKKAAFIGVTCMVKLLIGLSMVCSAGMYVFQIFDYYTGSRIILLVAMFEAIAIGWIYGANRFYDNMEQMFGFRPWIILKYTWQFSAPIFVFAIFILNTMAYKDLTYERSRGRTYEFPAWSITLGWLMACFSVVFIPIVAVYKIVTLTLPDEMEDTIVNRLKISIKPRLRAYQVCKGDVPNVDYIAVGDPNEIAP